MTAPTAPALTWADPHEAVVALPAGGTARIYYDWQRCGWTSDRPGACFQPVHATYVDVLPSLLSPTR
ncbi:hypothetical protein ACIA5D_36590 [Actinoplanes sp. NPDC051513]|uniref:hypothetical protein n=1 Tax=Actinoplanes sp. NPDC051513 TaxID=3363908 RepID=UPI0037BA7229